MPETPEDRARKTIDDLLDKTGWVVQDRDKANLNAARGVAIRAFPLKSGHGFADYLLYVDGQAVGVIEAKKEGEPLITFEIQTAKYSEGLPDGLKAYRRPLPFCYQSTGVETRFTNLLDPDPRSRQVFAFHRPETFAKWLEDETKSPGSILRARLQIMPPLIEDGLRAIQIRAIRELEKSLAANRPRALIQMASGAGKTFTACNFSYRLIKHAGARRILFLVDRNTLGEQTLREFQAFATPDERRKFVELYNVQHMRSNKLDDVCKVCITTIQRLYSMLKGEPEFDPGNEEASMFATGAVLKEPVPVSYNPALPVETFDFIVTDECHRSIYNLWRQVLDYFDAFIIGLTATPSKQTFGFFNQNLVTEYGHAQAVADRVNVDFDVYRIRTQITDLISIALRSPMLQDQIERKKTQTAQSNIFQGKIKVLVFPLPPLAEQLRIVAEVERRLSVIDELQATLEGDLKRAHRLRQPILKRAFEGKLVPQDPNDEPASVLLERIRAEREADKPKKAGTFRRRRRRTAEAETGELFR